MFSISLAGLLVALAVQLHLPRVWGRAGSAVVGTVNIVLAGYALHVIVLDVVLALVLASISANPFTVIPHAVAWALLGLHVFRRHTVVPSVWGRTCAPEAEAEVDSWRAWKANVLMRDRARDAVEVISGLVYRCVDGVSLEVDVYRPRGDNFCPSLLYLHGGGWVGGHRRMSRFMLHRLAAAGWATFAASYRLAPRFPLPAALEDAKAAVAWIRRNGGALGAMPGRPVVWGESAGGHLAALLALTAGEPRWQEGFEEADTFVRGALLFYPVTDLASAFEDDRHPGLRMVLERLAVRRPFTTNRDLYRALDPMHCELRDVPPVMLVQGTADALVPSSMSRRFARRLEDEGGHVELIEAPGMPHGFDLFPSPVQERVLGHALRFLDELELSRALVRGARASQRG